MKKSVIAGAVLVALCIGYFVGSSRTDTPAGNAMAGPVWDAALGSYVTDGTTLTVWKMKDGQPVEARTYSLSSGMSKPDEKGRANKQRFLTYEVFGGPAKDLGAKEPGK